MRVDSVWVAAVAFTTLLSCAPAEQLSEYQVRTAEGIVEGVDARRPGVKAFLGIPYAAPPVGEGRWRQPRPPRPWDGIRDAGHFGDRCIQTNPFPDMLFQSSRESEDCLSLSIWTGASPGESRPVMVWIHGGGYFSGAGDERRHDGSELASKGVVVVTINYRLGVMGFLAHPDLTGESERGTSGNYGLLDQVAALQWVRENISGFGGDPGNVTIFGESAGSFAVSALMASPSAQGLFHKAIGQSGAHLTGVALPLRGLKEAERDGTAFAAELDATSLDELRAATPEQLTAAASANSVRFTPIVDGYLLPRPVWDVFEEGEQADVPLLAGWNSAELKTPPVSIGEYRQLLAEAFPDDYAEAAEFYPATTERETWLSAIAVRSERQFVVFGTWKWLESHAATSQAPTFRYLFDQPLPTPEGPAPEDDPGASHASDIEYVFGTLDSKALAWGDVDRQVSDMMTTWWTNFATSGDPNGIGLVTWPAWTPGGEGRLMRINASPGSEPESNRARFEFLDAIESRERARN